MTLKEFFESRDMIAVHCRTKEQFDCLRKAFHDYGKTWSSGTDYLSFDPWQEYQDKTVLYNAYTYGHIDYALAGQRHVISFEELSLFDFCPTCGNALIPCKEERYCLVCKKFYDGKKWRTF